MIITAKKFIKKKLFKNKKGNFKNKGGWPGLKVLPNVDILIDVGIGHQGTYGLYKYFPKSRYIFIDPIIETRDAIQPLLDLDVRHTFVSTALGASNSKGIIHVRHPISQSGLYKLNNDLNGTTEEREVSIRTLDSLWSEIKTTGTVGIKVDVEGYELEVLKGAGEMLNILKFIILELPIGGARFKGSYSLEEAISFMNAQDFEAVSLRISGDGTNHCDIAFINKAFKIGK
tara:strand:+ start:17562 stop:18251 length:690 start_codon:yes stop_codon:yes gene_type:complete